MYTCLIVDDQPEGVSLLTDHAAKIGRLAVKLATTSSLEALVWLDKHKPDIIFADILMPDATGIDIADTLRWKWGNNMPVIVFTTGFNEYAIEGYEYGVFDYLLKPVSFKRFKQSVDRIISYLDRCSTGSPKPDFLFLDVDGEKMRVCFSDIIYIEGARNYIILRTPERKLITYCSMISIQSILPPERFLRVHKSYIVAVDKIHSIRGNRINIRVKEMQAIPIGITYRLEVMRKLNLVKI
jgi:DNA-binding LytR/AlgR family response regulator